MPKSGARGGRTQAQRKSIAAKNPTRAASAATKKVKRIEKGMSTSGKGKAAASNNVARERRISKINSKKAHKGY